jgi:hypothetical protein
MSALATFTVDEYQRMIACGAFVGPNEKRLELIRKELRMQSPQGTAHGELVAKLNDWSHDLLDEGHHFTAAGRWHLTDGFRVFRVPRAVMP